MLGCISFSSIQLTCAHFREELFRKLMCLLLALPFLLFSPAVCFCEAFKVLGHKYLFDIRVLNSSHTLLGKLPFHRCSGRGLLFAVLRFVLGHVLLYLPCCCAWWSEWALITSEKGFVISGNHSCKLWRSISSCVKF